MVDRGCSSGIYHSFDYGNKKFARAHGFLKKKIRPLEMKLPKFTKLFDKVASWNEKLLFWSWLYYFESE